MQKTALISIRSFVIFITRISTYHESYYSNRSSWAEETSIPEKSVPANALQIKHVTPTQPWGALQTRPCSKHSIGTTFGILE